MTTPFISVGDLHKWYSGVHALKGVNLDVQPGEVCGLVGDNGAGKSTLIKILAGVHRPDRGEIRIGGHLVDITSPKVAMKLGIETIYQDNSMVPTMSIARNLFIGREPLRFAIGGLRVVDHARKRDGESPRIAYVGLHFRSPEALWGDFSGGTGRGVPLARARNSSRKLLFLTNRPIIFR